MNKKMILCFLTVIGVLATSCSKEESGVENASDAAIIGSWNLTALEANNGRSETIYEGESIITQFEAVGKDFDVIVNFNEQPQSVTSEGTYTTVLTTSILGISDTEEVAGEDFFQTTEWRLDGNILYFGSGEEERGFTITQLTDTQMDLRLEVNEEVEALGILSIVTATYSMTLTK